MSTPPETKLVAVVDDDASARTAIHGVLKSVGFNVVSFGSAKEFLAADRLGDCACLIADLQMPEMSGLQLQERLAGEGRSIPIIFVTAYGDDKVRARAVKAGAVAFFEKPVNDDALIELVRRAIEG